MNQARQTSDSKQYHWTMCNHLALISASVLRFMMSHLQETKLKRNLYKE